VEAYHEDLRTREDSVKSGIEYVKEVEAITKEVSK